MNLYCMKSDPQITFLGTGSMYPSTFRNVTGNYIRFKEYDDFAILVIGVEVVIP